MLDTPLLATLAFVCAGGLFGIVAEPVTQYGNAPWLWLNMWIIIPTIGLAPSILLAAKLHEDKKA